MQPLLFKLCQNPQGRGLRCDQDGLFLDGEPLLARDTQDRFQPRPPSEIRKIFSDTYRVDADWASRIRSVDVVAKALNKSDVARAMMAAVLMKMPDPDDAIRIADVDDVLAKAGFDPDEPRDEHGRWTSGGSDEGRLIPVQIAPPIAGPMFGPLFGEGAAPLFGEGVRPYFGPGTDVLPPVVVPRDQAIPRTQDPYKAQNPYPNKPECVAEWAAAAKYCDDLRKRGKLGKRGYRGFGPSYQKCLLGMVSEECGGNPTGEEFA
jgi:hypothetical protein